MIFSRVYIFISMWLIIEKLRNLSRNKKSNLIKNYTNNIYK